MFPPGGRAAARRFCPLPGCTAGGVRFRRGERPARRGALPAAALAVLACLALACDAGSGPPADETGVPGVHDQGAGDVVVGLFVDRAVETGLDFVHVNGASGRFYYPEILPPGAALFDYDNDGDLDAYLVQSGTLGSDVPPSAHLVPPPAGRAPSGGRLFRNDLAPGPDGRPVLRFADATAASGIDADGYGLGVAAGDVDSDGFVDLYLTNFGPPRLYRNNGDGTFGDATAESGLTGAPGFGVSAAFVDYDRDGRLDLYVGHNVDYRLDNEAECPNQAGVRDYCPPQVYGGMPDRLYRNLGGGRFEDVSDAALVGGRFGPALGVVTADFDGDGWIDIYVANDGTENILWMNQGDGTLRDAALASGSAVSDLGVPEASMGVDAGDFDGDGDEDLFMTHLMREGNNLYVNDGTGRFTDRSAPAGLGASSLAYTGWGTSWVDYDNDGRLDLLAVNGTVVMVEGRESDSFPYDQRMTLFRNLGGGRFEALGDRAGSAFDRSAVGRGAAFGDVDNDGDVDVLVGNDAGPARLLINEVGNRNHWLGLRLVGAGGRDMLGARVVVERPGAAALWRRARSDGSYASANDPRVLVGLGDSEAAPAVTVHWPDGKAEAWPAVAVDGWHTLEQGTGDPVRVQTR